MWKKNTIQLWLPHDSMLSMEWFNSNYLKLNDDKCHLVISAHKYESMWAKVGQTKIYIERIFKC